MNKKLLLDVATDLRRLADSMTTFAESIAGSEQNASEAVNPESPVITLEQVRAVLADKSRSGKTAKVRELLISLGAEKLSEIDPARYAEVLKAAEAF